MSYRQTDDWFDNLLYLVLMGIDCFLKWCIYFIYQIIPEYEYKGFYVHVKTPFYSYKNTILYHIIFIVLVHTNGLYKTTKITFICIMVYKKSIYRRQPFKMPNLHIWRFSDFYVIRGGKHGPRCVQNTEALTLTKKNIWTYLLKL